MNIKSLKMIYMGTPDFSAKLLEDLIIAGFNISLVVTRPDALLGRKKILTPSPVKVIALRYNIPVFTPTKIRVDFDRVVEANADILLTFAYGQIVPSEVLKATKYGAFNLHGSLLPFYRGASPIQMALIDGLKETGVTLMAMVDKMDAGRMFAKVSFPLFEDDNFSTVSFKMAEVSKSLIENNLHSIVSGENKGSEQDEIRVTYAPLLKAKDEALDLKNDSAKRLVGKIAAFAPHIGAYVLYNGEMLKIYKANYKNNHVNKPLGQVFYEDKNLLLQANDGQISLLMLQKSGKKVMDALSFYNGEKQNFPLMVTSREFNA